MTCSDLPNVCVSDRGRFTLFEEHDVSFTRYQSGFSLFSVSNVLSDDFTTFALDTLAQRGAIGVDNDLSFTVFVGLRALRFRFGITLGLTLAIAVEVSRSILREIVEGTIEWLEIRLVPERRDTVTTTRTQIAERVISATIRRRCGCL